MELIINYWWLFLLSYFIGIILKSYQKQSKNIKDTHKYANIEDVITKYGIPNNIEKYDEYTKYTFKRSTNGWGHNKYKVDIFTLKNDKIVKHENFQE